MTGVLEWGPQEATVDVSRTVVITAEQDAWVARVMAERKWSRSQVVREALSALMRQPVLFLGTGTVLVSDT